MDEHERLIAAIQSCDAEKKDLFDELIRPFEAAAVRWAFAVLGDYELAQDAAQDAFLAAYEHLDQLREPRAFPAWLKRIVVSQCSRMTRGKTLHTRPLDEEADVVPDPASTAEDHDLREQLMDAVEALPEHERTVTELYYVTGYSQPEIAEQLQLPLTTVKKRLQVARERIRLAMPGVSDVRCALLLCDDTLDNAPDMTFDYRLLMHGYATSFAADDHDYYAFLPTERASYAWSTKR